MSEFPLPKNLAESVLWTVAYTDQFEYPLTEVEIGRRLIGIKATKEELAHTIHRLIQQKKLIKKEIAGVGKSFFALFGQGRLMELRIRRALVAKQKWMQVRKFVRLVSWLPWIQSIWVTGSLAMLNAESNQDIDFMIVTRPQRLWLTRAVVTTIALLAGKKRKPRGKEAETWCLNLWLDEDHLSMPATKKNTYTAYEVIQAKVVFERGYSAQQFWQANVWVRKFLPNWSFSVGKRSAGGSLPHRQNAFFNFLERCCFFGQMRYMRRRLTTEQVARGYAFFHPRQTADLVSRQWRRSMGKLE
jgi:hypothetical protein